VLYELGWYSRGLWSSSVSVFSKKAELIAAGGDGSSDPGALKSGRGRGQLEELRTDGEGRTGEDDGSASAAEEEAGGSCPGELELKAVAMLATNSDTGTADVRGVAAVARMRCKRFGREIGVGAGGEGSSGGGGETFRAKRP
jgi:hypothetical protein